MVYYLFNRMYTPQPKVLRIRRISLKGTKVSLSCVSIHTEIDFRLTSRAHSHSSRAGGGIQ